MYKSYHYNDMPQPINTTHKHEISQHKSDYEHSSDKIGFLNGLLGDLKNDDIILLVIIFVLLIDDCEDKLLLIALGFIFFSDLGE